MKPETKSKLLTAAVVFGGVIAIAVANKLGADKDVITAAAGALAIVAGMLRSMVLPDTTEPKS